MDRGERDRGYLAALARQTEAEDDRRVSKGGQSALGEEDEAREWARGVLDKGRVQQQATAGL